MRVGRCEEVKIVYVQVYALSEQWGERENVRLWFAAVYPDICLRYCHTDLSISLLISISAEMKIEADVQLNKTAATTTTKPARLTLFRFIHNPLSVVTFSFDRFRDCLSTRLRCQRKGTKHKKFRQTERGSERQN